MVRSDHLATIIRGNPLIQPFHSAPVTQDIHPTLQEMLSDANPMVVANALAALQEIQEISGRDMLQLNQNTLMKVRRGGGRDRRQGVKA